MDWLHRTRLLPWLPPRFNFPFLVVALLFAGVELLAGDVVGALVRLVGVLVVVPLLLLAVFRVIGYPDWWPHD